jgi:hypothetical protein
MTYALVAVAIAAVSGRCPAERVDLWQTWLALDAHNTTGVSKRELRERYRDGDRIIATLPDPGMDCEDAAGVALDGLWGE